MNNVKPNVNDGEKLCDRVLQHVRMLSPKSCNVWIPHQALGELETEQAIQAPSTEENMDRPVRSTLSREARGSTGSSRRRGPFHGRRLRFALLCQKED